MSRDKIVPGSKKEKEEIRAKDLTVILEDHPRTPADMGKAGINIEGMGGFVSEGKAALPILVEDIAAAQT